MAKRFFRRRLYVIIIVLAALVAEHGWSLYGSEETKQAEKEERQAIGGDGTSDNKGDEPEESRGRDRRFTVPRVIGRRDKGLILYRMAYTTSYNTATRTPNWVGWALTAEHTDGEHARKNHYFREDTDVPEPRAVYSDIREGECGYQRGHICPAGDNKWSKKAQEEAFLMTNICPQDGHLNQNDWKYLEQACREWANTYKTAYIVAGPIFRSKPYRTVGENKVAVPDAFFKVVMVYKGKNPQAIGFIYDNVSGHHDMEHYARSVDEVEQLTGLDFFHELDDTVEEKIEAQCDFSAF